jgi:hypothetical protein
MKPSTAKKKGADTEVKYVDYLRSHGVPNAERRHLNGVLDKGDIAGWNASDGSWNVVVEVKSGASLKIPQWLAELDAEVANANAATGHIVVRPKGKPDPEDWFVIMPVNEFMDLMQEAGYID